MLKFQSGVSQGETLTSSELHSLTRTLKATLGLGVRVSQAPVSDHGAEDVSCQHEALHYETARHPV